MHYIFLRDILTTPQMIEPQMAAMFLPIFRGVMMGFQMENDEKISLQSAIETKCGTGKKKKCVNLVDLKGYMSRNDGDCGLVGTRKLSDLLLKADADQNIIGHILRIDSGGGAANSVPELADAIKSLSKPIVAFVDGMMCSAAMYAGSYCNYIIANREDDRVGCIGTMMQIVDYPKRAEISSGEIALRIYADGSEEKNLEYEEALKDNVKLIKDNILNPMNDKFVNAIKANRFSVKEDQLKGRTYFAKDVVGSLIDDIGPLQKAVDKVVELADFKTTNTNNINNMKYDNINKIASCAVLEESEGTVTLTTEQMKDIDYELGEAVKTVESTTAKLKEAEKSVLTLRESVAAKEKRITELESALEKHGKPMVENQFANGDPDQTKEDIGEEDSLDFCKAFLNRRNK